MHRILYLQSFAWSYGIILLAKRKKAYSPNGIVSQSPGLRAARYPGSVSPHFPNPERVAASPLRCAFSPSYRNRWPGFSCIYGLLHQSAIDDREGKDRCNPFQG